MTRAAFRKIDVTRALAAAKDAGYAHPTLRFPPEGGFELLTFPVPDTPGAKPSPWGPIDEVDY